MAAFDNTDDREVITGGIENDTFLIVDGTNGAGDDVFDGGAGDDTAYGGNGDDRLTGGLGDDVLIGGIGTNTIAGGDGFDYVATDRLSGTVTGGEDTDSLSLSGVGDVDMVIDMAATMIGGLAFSGFENIYAGVGDDTMTGSSGNDGLGGTGGSDLIRGMDGDDVITVDNLGQNDDDSAYGGAGNDYIGTAAQAATRSSSM
jgi:Ca2+-binding RTX toxin-like protein